MVPARPRGEPGPVGEAPAERGELGPEPLRERNEPLLPLLWRRGLIRLRVLDGMDDVNDDIGLGPRSDLVVEMGLRWMLTPAIGSAIVSGIDDRRPSLLLAPFLGWYAGGGGRGERGWGSKCWEG